MAGYGARTNPAAGVLQPLYAKTLALEDPAGNRLVLITTDLVGMRAKFTDGIAEEIKTKHSLARDQLMFTCSHTHSGPVLADSLEGEVWYLEQAHPGITGLFFMGCGGDANPLPRRTVELCQNYGRQLASAVEAALKTSPGTATWVGRITAFCSPSNRA